MGFGNAPTPGLCPEGIPDQPNFDRERYVGQWYNYLANDLVNIPENSDCGGAYYEKLNERQISINNTAATQVEFMFILLSLADAAFWPFSAAGSSLSLMRLN